MDRARGIFFTSISLSSAIIPQDGQMTRNLYHELYLKAVVIQDQSQRERT